ncbi:TPA: helix-turn-helix transcriptional regulator [Pasteurella multocida]|uniref:S24 family peptidase n=1 Tax=Pasteurella multocida TaxID=747 RepID=UPI0020225774|nr:helix-turn-helix transcriptional regulator [Pasteurella multocida]MCL7818985.1 helix-turn-helix transcriptional regulator [Pasteurella multocida]HDR0997872.1 helix-turn-helix transcriptional regulator [Pasteurella multocida]HDR1014701.1 helix-turn-helix transcriptional regulator [Pasteurella multocida]HDR1017655.1 helix-turn-helix transcriptional regulator [Pasteurella multocida]HDR1055263.1 helix-turn-helix transcriptional regulator [Pasteurella multocida]
MNLDKNELTQVRRENLKKWFSDKVVPEKDRSYVSQLISGKTPSFGEKAARRLESENGMPPFYLDIKQSSIESNVKDIGSFDLWDRHTPLHDDEVEVPFLKDIHFAAGNGFSDDIMDYNNFKLRFSKATLRKQGVQYDNAVCITADGDSMEPVIPDGATVGIDRGNTTIKDGKIYAINHGGLLRIKILHKMPNEQVRIRSYNPDSAPEEVVDLSEITILGKVFWWSVLCD